MDIKVFENIKYDEVSKLLLQSYISHWGTVGTPEWDPKYVEYLHKTYIRPDGLYVGVFDDNKLIGIGTGFVTNWHVAEIGKMMAMCICNFGVTPEHQRKGIGTKMVNTLVENAEAIGLDCIYRICNEDLKDHLLLSKCGFVKKLKNVNQMAKIMGSDMVEKTARIKNMGKVMKQLVKTVAGMPDEKKGIQEGNIRDGTMDDVKICVDILNNYQSTDEISRIWTEEEFAKIIQNAKILSGSKFDSFFYIWETTSAVKAFTWGRFEYVKWSTGDSPVNIIHDTGFVKDLDKKEKIRFLTSVLIKLKQKVPNAYATNAAHCHHEEKAFGKAGFNDDRSKRPLYIKGLTTEGKKWLQSDWKLKSYYIPYQR
ncbi:MAG: GNAT family N-acetyltransferase [Candidatus Helarchaeota archaeon]